MGEAAWELELALGRSVRGVVRPAVTRAIDGRTGVAVVRLSEWRGGWDSLSTRQRMRVAFLDALTTPPTDAARRSVGWRVGRGQSLLTGTERRMLRRLLDSPSLLGIAPDLGPDGAQVLRDRAQRMLRRSSIQAPRALIRETLAWDELRLAEALEDNGYTSVAHRHYESATERLDARDRHDRGRGARARAGRDRTARRLGLARAAAYVAVVLGGALAFMAGGAVVPADAGTHTLAAKPTPTWAIVVDVVGFFVVYAGIAAGAVYLTWRAVRKRMPKRWLASQRYIHVRWRREMTKTVRRLSGIIGGERILVVHSGPYDPETLGRIAADIRAVLGTPRTLVDGPFGRRWAFGDHERGYYEVSAGNLLSFERGTAEVAQMLRDETALRDTIDVLLAPNDVWALVAPEFGRELFAAAYGIDVDGLVRADPMAELRAEHGKAAWARLNDELAALDRPADGLIEWLLKRPPGREIEANRGRIVIRPGMPSARWEPIRTPDEAVGERPAWLTIFGPDETGRPAAWRQDRDAKPSAPTDAVELPVSSGPIDDDTLVRAWEAKDSRVVVRLGDPSTYLLVMARRGAILLRHVGAVAAVVGTLTAGLLAVHALVTPGRASADTLAAGDAEPSSATTGFFVVLSAVVITIAVMAIRAVTRGVKWLARKRRPKAVRLVELRWRDRVSDAFEGVERRTDDPILVVHTGLDPRVTEDLDMLFGAREIKVEGPRGRPIQVEAPSAYVRVSAGSPLLGNEAAGELARRLRIESDLRPELVVLRAADELWTLHATLTGADFAATLLGGHDRGTVPDSDVTRRMMARGQEAWERVRDALGSDAAADRWVSWMVDRFGTHIESTRRGDVLIRPGRVGAPWDSVRSPQEEVNFLVSYSSRLAHVTTGRPGEAPAAWRIDDDADFDAEMEPVELPVSSGRVDRSSRIKAWSAKGSRVVVRLGDPSTYLVIANGAMFLRRVGAVIAIVGSFTAALLAVQALVTPGRASAETGAAGDAGPSSATTGVFVVLSVVAITSAVVAIRGVKRRARKRRSVAERPGDLTWGDLVEDAFEAAATGSGDNPVLILHTGFDPRVSADLDAVFGSREMQIEGPGGRLVDVEAPRPYRRISVGSSLLGNTAAGELAKRVQAEGELRPELVVLRGGDELWAMYATPLGSDFAATLLGGHGLGAVPDSDVTRRMLVRGQEAWARVREALGSDEAAHRWVTWMAARSGSHTAGTGHGDVFVVAGREFEPWEHMRSPADVADDLIADSRLLAHVTTGRQGEPAAAWRVEEDADLGTPMEPVALPVSSGPISRGTASLPGPRRARSVLVRLGDPSTYLVIANGAMFLRRVGAVIAIVGSFTAALLAVQALVTPGRASADTMDAPVAPAPDPAADLLTALEPTLYVSAAFVAYAAYHRVADRRRHARGDLGDAAAPRWTGLRVIAVMAAGLAADWLVSVLWPRAAGDVTTTGQMTAATQAVVLLGIGAAGTVAVYLLHRGGLWLQDHTEFGRRPGTGRNKLLRWRREVEKTLTARREKRGSEIIVIYGGLRGDIKALRAIRRDLRRLFGPDERAAFWEVSAGDVPLHGKDTVGLLASLALEQEFDEDFGTKLRVLRGDGERLVLHAALLEFPHELPSPTLRDAAHDANRRLAEDDLLGDELLAWMSEQSEDLRVARLPDRHVVVRPARQTAPWGAVRTPEQARGELYPYRGAVPWLFVTGSAHGEPAAAWERPLDAPLKQAMRGVELPTSSGRVGRFTAIDVWSTEEARTVVRLPDASLRDVTYLVVIPAKAAMFLRKAPRSRFMHPGIWVIPAVLATLLALPALVAPPTAAADTLTGVQGHDAMKLDGIDVVWDWLSQLAPHVPVAVLLAVVYALSKSRSNRTPSGAIEPADASTLERFAERARDRQRAFERQRDEVFAELRAADAASIAHATDALVLEAAEEYEEDATRAYLGRPAGRTHEQENERLIAAHTYDHALAAVGAARERLQQDESLVGVRDELAAFAAWLDGFVETHGSWVERIDDAVAGARPVDVVLAELERAIEQARAYGGTALTDPGLVYLGDLAAAFRAASVDDATWEAHFASRAPEGQTFDKFVAKKVVGLSDKSLFSVVVRPFRTVEGSLELVLDALWSEDPERGRLFRLAQLAAGGLQVGALRHYLAMERAEQLGAPNVSDVDTELIVDAFRRRPQSEREVAPDPHGLRRSIDVLRVAPPATLVLYWALEPSGRLRDAEEFVAAVVPVHGAVIQRHRAGFFARMAELFPQLVARGIDPAHLLRVQGELGAAALATGIESAGPVLRKLPAILLATDVLSPSLSEAERRALRWAAESPEQFDAARVQLALRGGMDAPELGGAIVVLLGPLFRAPTGQLEEMYWSVGERTSTLWEFRETGPAVAARKARERFFDEIAWSDDVTAVVRAADLNDPAWLDAFSALFRSGGAVHEAFSREGLPASALLAEPLQLVAARRAALAPVAPDTAVELLGLVDVPAADAEAFGQLVAGRTASLAALSRDQLTEVLQIGVLRRLRNRVELLDAWFEWTGLDRDWPRADRERLAALLPALVEREPRLVSRMRPPAELLDESEFYLESSLIDRDGMAARAARVGEAGDARLAQAERDVHFVRAEIVRIFATVRDRKTVENPWVRDRTGRHPTLSDREQREIMSRSRDAVAPDLTFAGIHIPAGDGMSDAERSREADKQLAKLVTAEDLLERVEMSEQAITYTDASGAGFKVAAADNAFLGFVAARPGSDTRREALATTLLGTAVGAHAGDEFGAGMGDVHGGTGGAWLPDVLAVAAPVAAVAALLIWWVRSGHTRGSPWAAIRGAFRRLRNAVVAVAMLAVSLLAIAAPATADPDGSSPPPAGRERVEAVRERLADDIASADVLRDRSKITIGDAHAWADRAVVLADRIVTLDPAAADEATALVERLDVAASGQSRVWTAATVDKRSLDAARDVLADPWQTKDQVEAAETEAERIEDRVEQGADDLDDRVADFATAKDELMALQRDVAGAPWRPSMAAIAVVVAALGAAAWRRGRRWVASARGAVVATTAIAAAAMYELNAMLAVAMRQLATLDPWASLPVFEAPPLAGAMLAVSTVAGALALARWATQGVRRSYALAGAAALGALLATALDLAVDGRLVTVADGWPVTPISAAAAVGIVVLATVTVRAVGRMLRGAIAPDQVNDAPEPPITAAEARDRWRERADEAAVAYRMLVRAAGRSLDDGELAHLKTWVDDALGRDEIHATDLPGEKRRSGPFQHDNDLNRLADDITDVFRRRLAADDTLAALDELGRRGPRTGRGAFVVAIAALIALVAAPRHEADASSAAGLAPVRVATEQPAPDTERERAIADVDAARANLEHRLDRARADAVAADTAYRAALSARWERPDRAEQLRHVMEDAAGHLDSARHVMSRGSARLPLLDAVERPLPEHSGLPIGARGCRPRDLARERRHRGGHAVPPPGRMGPACVSLRHRVQAALAPARRPRHGAARGGRGPAAPGRGHDRCRGGPCRGRSCDRRGRSRGRSALGLARDAFLAPAAPPAEPSDGRSPARARGQAEAGARSLHRRDRTDRATYGSGGSACGGRSAASAVLARRSNSRRARRSRSWTRSSPAASVTRPGCWRNTAASSSGCGSASRTSGVAATSRSARGFRSVRAAGAHTSGFPASPYSSAFRRHSTPRDG